MITQTAFGTRPEQVESIPPPKGKRGPKPEHLVIAGDWKEAVKKSFEKKSPPAAKSPT